MSDYNGWTNRETWLVNIWFLDGIEEPMSADEIENMVHEYVGEQAGFVSDMMDLGCIDWIELADSTEELGQ